MLNTERPSSQHTALDQYDSRTLVRALASDHAVAVQAVVDAGDALAAAVDAAVSRLNAGGRMIYVGAGTSGRLGLLDSVELNPTFSWPTERAVAFLAGGPSAIHQAVEGAEDDEAAGARAMSEAGVNGNDVVILLAASGGTPYTLGALRAAKSLTALTIGIANNPNAPISNEAEIGIVLNTGAEAISGSTRLKAGTAQKVALNTLSSAIMVRLHKVYGNLMVDVRATNKKLVIRAVRLTAQAVKCDEAQARLALDACDFSVKAGAARAKLSSVGGSVRSALSGLAT
jgi:N-acetylmuramic acid 6-phosphate etherase